MSLSGISSSNLFNYDNQNIQNKVQHFRQEFEQLGEDLQSGNLAAAQTDFATLQQLGSNSSSTSSTASSNPLEQAFNQLGQDLQSGNLSAAQQDFTHIQQYLQSRAAQAHGAPSSPARRWRPVESHHPALSATRTGVAIRRSVERAANL